MQTTLSPELVSQFPGVANDHDWLRKRSNGVMRPGSVLFQAAQSAFQAPGGGEVQLVKTARSLEGLGLPVRPFQPWLDRIEQARLLHLFGMTREGLALALLARARNVPVVVSPICWYEPRAFRTLEPVWHGQAKAWLHWCLRNCAPRWPHWRRALLQLADAILPNSLREARQLQRLFGIDRGKIPVVPNGVESTFAHADPALFQTKSGLSEYVLYVGRIEERKNLLALIGALRPLGMPLAVIGNPVPGQDAYHAACLEAGKGFVHWFGGMTNDDPLLASAYAGARVLALVSWFETPGLAALEGALAGCDLAITPLGCTKEYFGDRAEYAHPARPREIQAAVRRAWSRTKQPDLASWVGSRYLWSHVARKTAEVYDDLTT